MRVKEIKREKEVRMKTRQRKGRCNRVRKVRGEIK